MSDEELRKMMEFIVKRQEVFADNMDKAEVRMNCLESAFVGLFNVVNETANNQKSLPKHRSAQTSD